MFAQEFYGMQRYQILMICDMLQQLVEDLEGLLDQMRSLACAQCIIGMNTRLKDQLSAVELSPVKNAFILSASKLMLYKVQKNLTDLLIEGHHLRREQRRSVIRIIQRIQQAKQLMNAN